MQENNLHRLDYTLAAWGAVICLFGLLTLAERREWFDLTFSGEFWPFILIAIGGGRLAQPPNPAAGRPRRAGGFLLFIGLWALVNELQVAGLDYQHSWPIIIVGVGVAMVWRALHGDPICGHISPRSDHAA
jgi:hypothetical protein